jgi:hypothetical protein
MSARQRCNATLAGESNSNSAGKGRAQSRRFPHVSCSVPHRRSPEVQRKEGERENNAAEAPSTSPEVCQRMAQNRAPWDAPRPNGEFLAALTGGGRDTGVQHSPEKRRFFWISSASGVEVSRGRSVARHEPSSPSATAAPAKRIFPRMGVAAAQNDLSVGFVTTGLPWATH